MVREWYIYDYTHEMIISGYATEAEAKEEASRVMAELPGLKIVVLPRSHELVRRYAETHPAWARREGFTSALGGVHAEVERTHDILRRAGY